MIPHDNPHQERRETLLTVVLSGLAASAVLFFLILLSGGFILYVLLAVSGIVALGFFHYLVWGFAMNRDVADDRALEESQQRALNGEMHRDKIRHKRF